jgi:hypothetical protein
MWSSRNAFTSALKEIDPTPQFKATGKHPGEAALSNASTRLALAMIPNRKLELEEILQLGRHGTLGRSVYNAKESRQA